MAADLDLTRLAFDTEAMLDGLERWVRCESPTFDAAAVNAMMTLAAGDLQRAGAAVARVPGRGGYGDCVLADFPHPRRGEPGILLMGHLDTVHPVGTLKALPFRREGRAVLRPGHPRHEGRQRRGAGGGGRAGAGGDRDAAAGQRPADERRGGGQSLHARADRRHRAAAPLRPRPGTGPPRQRRRHRPLRDRALRPAGDRPPEPRRIDAGGGALRHRHHGAADPRHRGDDRRGLHLQRRGWWAAAGG